MGNVVINTNLKTLKLFKRGKVRDIYEIGDQLLIVATDRISAFDVVLPDGIPNKGKVLNALSLFWFDFTKDIIPNHVLLSQEIDGLTDEERKIMEGRSMLVKRTRPLPVECIVRGYISGSAWKEYQNTGSISGIRLSPGLKESEKLPEPLFTPSTKAESGHDINITFEDVKKLVGKNVAARLKDVSIKIYLKASKYAEEQGIIIADTKLEFGIYQNELILIDELLTPDSSRFWSKKEYEPGRPQSSFDKQYVRDYLEQIRWDKNPPAPHLPQEVIEETSKKYIEAYKRLVGCGQKF